MPIIRKLIEYGANVNFASPTTGQTPLMVAASVQNSAYALVLLENGAIDSINHQDTNGRSALMYAASRGTANNCSILLERGADSTLMDVNKMTALNYALKRHVQKDDPIAADNKKAIVEIFRSLEAAKGNGAVPAQNDGDKH